MAMVNQSDYETKAQVQAATIPAPVIYFRIAGYSAAGDGGGALYKRVGAEPPHSGKIQSADGAWWEIAEQVLSIKMFGGVGDGVSATLTGTDNYAALMAAYSVVSYRGKGAVYIPYGIYLFLTSPIYVFPSRIGSIRVFGDGPDATTLLFPHTYGPQFSYNGPATSVCFEQMLIQTGTRGGNIGLSLLQPVDANGLGAYVPSYLNNIMLRGSDDGGGGGNNHWQVGVYVECVSGTNLNNVTVWGGVAAGVGAFYTGRPNCFSVAHNLVNFTANNIRNAVRIGTKVQGVQSINANIISSGDGVQVIAGLSGVAEVSFIGGQMTCGGWCFSILSTTQNLSIQSNPFMAGTSGGIMTGAAVAVTGSINGNQMFANTGSSGTGILIQGPSAIAGYGPLSIADNFISKFDTAISLSATSSSVAVGWNNGLGNTKWVVDAGTANLIATPVSGSKETGWTAMTGAANKAGAYDVSTVTLAQLAARVASLQAALTSKGIIGP
jgi:hypothetical protein